MPRVRKLTRLRLRRVLRIYDHMLYAQLADYREKEQAAWSRRLFRFIDSQVGSVLFSAAVCAAGVHLADIAPVARSLRIDVAIAESDGRLVKLNIDADAAWALLHPAAEAPAPCAVAEQDAPPAADCASA